MKKTHWNTWDIRCTDTSSPYPGDAGEEIVAPLGRRLDPSARLGGDKGGRLILRANGLVLGTIHPREGAPSATAAMDLGVGEAVHTHTTHPRTRISTSAMLSLALRLSCSKLKSKRIWARRMPTTAKMSWKTSWMPQIWEGG